MDKVRGWIKGRPIVWAIGILVVGLIIGAAIGSSGKGGLESERTELESEVARVASERDEMRDERTAAEGKASRVEGLRSKIVSEAQDRATKIVGGAKAEKQELGSLASEVTAAEGELESIQGSVIGAEEEKAKSTIPGDGTFKAEVDFIPGTYRAPGGPGCYWATLNSANPYDIASNENASGPTIATIETPYFQTEDCGTWERIE